MFKLWMETTKTCRRKYVHKAQMVPNKINPVDPQKNFIIKMENF